MSIREDVELYTKLSGEDGSQETIATIGAYLRGYEQGKEDAEPHWIPCSERLPETTGEYLVTKREMYTHRLIVDIAMYFVNDGWHKADPVIAWQALPEPYKGVTE